MKRKLGGLSVQMKRTDKAMSEYIRAKTPYCVICGSREQLQAAHLISRTAKSVRFDLQNVFTNCAGHNLRHEYHPEVCTEWYIRTFGEGQYLDLVVRSKQIRKWTVDELKELEEHFNELRRAL
jgi:hypothetical protein